MRVLVTGSRDWTHAGSVRTALETVYAPGAILCHGAARGLDTLAARIGAELGYIIEAHPADWEAQGKRAGVLRNAHMVSLGANYCFGFPLASSIGTWDCVKRAKAARIPTFIYDINTHQWVQYT